MNNDFILIIPARLNSTRLPRKLLIKINGISIINRTYNQALKALNNHEKIVIATDSLEIKKHCKSFGARVIMTSPNCLTGTDRVAEVAKSIKVKQYINLQGDEPIFPIESLSLFIKEVTKNPFDVHTAIKLIDSEEDYRNQSIPKMVFSKSNNLLFSSRAPIPSNKLDKFKVAYKHVCIYAFNENHLRAYKNCDKKTFFEYEEDLEINRFLELDIRVKCVELTKSGKALDTKEDLKVISEIINKIEN